MSVFSLDCIAMQRVSVKAMQKLSGFAETVDDIDAVKKQIGKLFEYQAIASRK